MSKLRLLDLALLVLAGLLGWQVRREWIDSHARAQALLQGGLPPSKVPGLAPLDKVDPPTAAAYAEVATKNLFSADRNPNVIVDPPKPEPEKPPPPFPVAHGVMMWEGVPPTIVLSEKAGGPQKGYQAGQSIGQWKLLSVDNSYVDLEWDGKEFKKRIDELIVRTPIADDSEPAASKSKGARPKPAAPPPSSGSRSGPGVDVGGGLKGCVPGDASPDGTVVDGMKKVVTATPFGNGCRWEPAK
ncbi:MAG: hypothetical protein ABSH31_00310 [Bryobacteraceae bacterium]